MTIDAVFTTDDAVTRVKRYLYMTHRVPLIHPSMQRDLDLLIRDAVEAVVSEKLMLPLNEHHRLMDKAVEDALENMPKDEYDRGYEHALNDISLLASDDQEEETPAA